MGNRIFIEPDQGIVVSKEGKDATNPSLPDADKIFDSAWSFSGQIVFAKIVQIDVPAGAHDKTNDFMYPESFPELPSAEVYWAGNWIKGTQPRPPLPSPTNGMLTSFPVASYSPISGLNLQITNMNDRIRLRTTRSGSGLEYGFWFYLRILLV